MGAVAAASRKRRFIRSDNRSAKDRAFDDPNARGERRPMIRQLSANIATAFATLPPAPPATTFDDYLDFELLNRLSVVEHQNVLYVDEADWFRAIRLQDRGLVFATRIGTRCATRLTDAGREFLATSRFESGGAR